MNAIDSYGGRGVNPDRLSAVLEHAGRTVLDVGCGSGAYVLELKDNYDIRGVDAVRFDQWGAAPDLFAVADVSELGADSEAFDTVLCFETLEHLADPEGAIRAFHRMTRNNLILSVPNCELPPGLEASRLIYYHWIDRTHRNFYTSDSLRHLLESNGFRVVVMRGINEIDLWPTLRECFNLEGLVGWGLRRVLARRRRLAYRMTTLVVASKEAVLDPATTIE